MICLLLIGRRRRRIRIGKGIVVIFELLVVNIPYASDAAAPAAISGQWFLWRLEGFSRRRRRRRRQWRLFLCDPF